jgi:hypothetical protein
VQNAFQSSCKWYGVTVAIALVNLLQSIESAGVCASIVQIAHIYIIRCRPIVYIYICVYIYIYVHIYIMIVTWRPLQISALGRPRGWPLQHPLPMWTFGIGLLKRSLHEFFVTDVE